MRMALMGWRLSLLASLGVPVAGCGGKADGSKPEGLPPCTNATTDTGGFVHCAERYAHRASIGECASMLPTSASFDPLVYPNAECLADADCGSPLSYCRVTGMLPAPRCFGGCVTDADCGQNMVCVCGDPIGECSLASCTTDSDCLDGLCVGAQHSTGCGTAWDFKCTSPLDECLSDEECPGSCVVSADGPRECAPVSTCGRPFLVGGQLRFAEPRATSGWRGESSTKVELDAQEQGALAAHWTELGLMEHASVAAFARFVLELLSLGAPAALVKRAQAALSDEIAHAELCFGLASRYSGHDVGPAALALDGALERRTPVEIGLNAFVEACLGETQAAAEAEASLEQATDPDVRRVLGKIVADEARHAELGFEFVRWLLGTLAAEECAELEAGIRRELQLRLRVRAGTQNDGVEVRCHGLLGARDRAEARRLALLEVCIPCVNALLTPMRRSA
jgi:hypothetical protein